MKIWNMVPDSRVTFREDASCQMSVHEICLHNCSLSQASFRRKLIDMLVFAAVI